MSNEMLINKIIGIKKWVKKDNSDIVVETISLTNNIIYFNYIDNPLAVHLQDSFSGFLSDFKPYNEEVKKIPILKGSVNIGRKDDSNKPRYSLLPTGTINQVVQVLEYGASDKYEVDNWQKIPDARRRFYDAAMRHIDAWWNGEIIDLDKDGVKGSQLPHLAHAICCLLFLMWFDNKGE